MTIPFNSDDLPKDTLTRIFCHAASSKVGLKTVLTGCLVCKNWGKAISEYLTGTWKEVMNLPELNNEVISLESMKNLDKVSVLFRFKKLSEACHSSDVLLSVGNYKKASIPFCLNLEKIWSRVQKQITSEERPLQTALEINAWLNNPKNQVQIDRIAQLNLSTLGLSVLPYAITKFTQISNLNLSRNQLQILPDIFDKFPKLSEVNISHNQLRHVPKTLDKLVDELISYNAAGNPIKYATFEQPQQRIVQGRYFPPQ